MTSSYLEAIEKNIQKAKAQIEVGHALERLRQNKDFKKVVMDGYFTDEAVRLVHLKGDPTMQTEASQRSIIQQIDAIAAFSSFLTTVMHKAEMAQASLEADEETRAELQAEELNRE